MDTKVDRPVSSIDPFSHAFLRDPYPHHESLREAGPVAWLEQYGIWAMARHQEVRDALTDWQTYCSSAGVGLSDFRKEPPWRPPSIILEADPPLHTRTRAVLTRILPPAAINIRARRSNARRTLGRAWLTGARSMHGGIWPKPIRENLSGRGGNFRGGCEKPAPYGSMVFNPFGPRNDLFERAMANAGPVRDWIMSKCSRAALAPADWECRSRRRRFRCELTEAEAGMLVRRSLSAGVDTTVYALGNALVLCRYPEQWSSFATIRA